MSNLKIAFVLCGVLLAISTFGMLLSAFFTYHLFAPGTYLASVLFLFFTVANARLIVKAVEHFIEAVNYARKIQETK